MRACTKTGCSRPAIATCSFNYGRRQIWFTPLADDREPGCIDLCADHVARFGAPLGWDIADLRTEHGQAAAAS
jgi:hypothetical protein